MSARTVLRAASILLACSLLQAARLPVKTYTTADGLARDHILCIVQDSHGFLWFCTAEGLSRFDGYQFTNYRTEQGLPSNAVYDFLETRQGSYWIATGGGLCRFEPAARGSSRFHCDPATPGTPVVAMLYGDAEGGVWCGADYNILHRGPKDSSFRRVDIPTVPDTSFTAILMDRRGTLWLGSSTGLYRRDPDGATRHYIIADGLSNHYIMALAEDREGRLWVGTRMGLIRFDDVAAPGQPLAAPPRLRVFTTKDGLPGTRIESLLQASDGTLWVGTNKGMAKRVSGKPRHRGEFQSYTLAQGLSARAVGALAEDQDGNLWIGTFGSGAMKLAPSGFTTYSEADGFPFAGMLTESRQGELCAFSREETDLRVIRFEGGRFVPIRPAWPKNIKYFGWGSGQVAVHDEAGEWWIGTGQGLCRFPPLTRVDQLSVTPPKTVYTTRDGLPGDGIFRVFGDSRGDIWIGTIGPNTEDGLARWGRSTRTIQTFAEADGLPRRPVPTAFAEDRSGAVWIGLFHGGLARYRPGTRRFSTYTAADGVAGGVRALSVDSAGRLWIGTSRGLLRLDDPARDLPQFTAYTTATGLSSDFIAAIVEDRRGRIYVATGRGIDRFEPRPEGPGRIKHYTAADGIVAGELDLAFRDRRGALWFTTPLGASQLNPTEDAPRPPPPVLLTGLSISGVPHPISDLGETAVPGLELRKTPLRVDFVGLDFSPGEALRYQYMLEGADHEWSPATDQRTVVYASLASGSYRFLVRAVASDGSVSSRPATLAFTILPPVWRTWWFLSACVIAALLILSAIHRYRVAQLLAVAGVRTRIATDLHDDIGASLSQIAILSEVAQRTLNGGSPRSILPLSEIAGISRELVDSMSDIVWAVNPEHDRLSNLVYRIRRFANDVLQNRGIGLLFRSSLADRDLRVDADTRRQVYLIFKEAVHNVVRHSGADRVEVDLDRVGDQITLRIRDNGQGFDPCAGYEGRGLRNMRKRAAALGGTLDLESVPGQGALVRMAVPIRRHNLWHRTPKR